MRLLPAVLLITITTLTLPVHAAAPGGPTGPDTFLYSVEPEDLPERPTTPRIGYWYTIQPGDDIWLIALAHGVDMSALATVNGLTDPYWIYPGDRLWVPAEPAVVKHPPAPTPTPAPIAAPVAFDAPGEAAQAVTTTIEAPEAAPPIEAPEAVTGTAPPPVDQAPPAPPENAPTEAFAMAASQVQVLEISDQAALILRLMNEKRAEYGLPAFTWSAELAQAAQAHAEDLAARGWGGHIGSDGARLRTRYARVGYGATWASENWANARGAQQAFDMWWYEPPGADPHRQNILGPNYAEAGIGIAKGGWGYYFVADFGSR